MNVYIQSEKIKLTIIAVCCCVEQNLFRFESCAGLPLFFSLFFFFLSFFFSSFLGGGVEVGGGETLVERLISIHHGNYSTIFCFRADPLSSSRTFDPERVNVAPHSAFWISTEVVTALVSCYTAGATWKCWNFYARSVYTALHNHFIRSHMCTVHARLAVT